MGSALSIFILDYWNYFNWTRPLRPWSHWYQHVRIGSVINEQTLLQMSTAIVRERWCGMLYNMKMPSIVCSMNVFWRQGGTCEIYRQKGKSTSHNSQNNLKFKTNFLFLLRFCTFMQTVLLKVHSHDVSSRWGADQTPIGRSSDVTTSVVTLGMPESRSMTNGL